MLSNIKDGVQFCYSDILEVTKSTKRKNGYIKIAINDDLAEALINQMVKRTYDDITIKDLRLMWDYMKKENRSRIK